MTDTVKKETNINSFKIVYETDISNELFNKLILYEYLCTEAMANMGQPRYYYFHVKKYKN